VHSQQKKKEAIQESEKKKKELSHEVEGPGAYSQLLVELMERRTNTTTAERSPSIN